jgi:hypothetical protein
MRLRWTWLCVAIGGLAVAGCPSCKRCERDNELEYVFPIRWTS